MSHYSLVIIGIFRFELVTMIIKILMVIVVFCFALIMCGLFSCGHCRKRAEEESSILEQ